MHKFVFLSVFSVLISASLPASLPIMQSATSMNETQVIILGERDKRYRYFLQHGDSQISPTSVSKHDGQPYSKQSGKVLYHLSFSGLKPGATYVLKIYADKELLDDRYLRTFPKSKRGEVLRFAVGSCMDDAYDGDAIWRSLLAQKPELLFLIGDNVYADKRITGHNLHTDQMSAPQKVARPSDMWQRYLETRSKLLLFRTKHLVPVIATWDDHDYGMNNGCIEYPFKKEAKSIFKAFFIGQESSNFKPSGIGVSSLFTLGNFSFFMLDNRSFRTPRGKKSPQHHFGKKQLQWLWRNMQGKKHALLFSGDQFFADYHRFESFQEVYQSDKKTANAYLVFFWR